MTDRHRLPLIELLTELFLLLYCLQNLTLGSALLSSSNKQQQSSLKSAQNENLAQNSSSEKRRVFKKSKSKSLVGSDAFTNLKTCNEFTKTNVTDARRKSAVDKSNKNEDYEKKQKILARTKSEYLDNDRNLRRSLLVTRMGSSFETYRESLSLTNQRPVSTELTNQRPVSSSLDNDLCDQNDNSYRIQAEVHEKGKLNC